MQFRYDAILLGKGRKQNGKPGQLLEVDAQTLTTDLQVGKCDKVIRI